MIKDYSLSLSLSRSLPPSPFLTDRIAPRTIKHDIVCVCMRERERGGGGERDARCVHRLNTAFPSNRKRSIAFNRPSDRLNRFRFRRIERLRSATPKFDYDRTLLRYNRITRECVKRAFSFFFSFFLLQSRRIFVLCRFCAIVSVTRKIRRIVGRTNGN